MVFSLWWWLLIHIHDIVNIKKKILKGGEEGDCYRYVMNSTIA